MNSLSQRINLDIVSLNDFFNTWVKIKDYSPIAGELAKHILLVQTRITRELLMIQSVIRKPNSKKLHYTKSQKISLDILDGNLKKYKIERGYER